MPVSSRKTRRVGSQSNQATARIEELYRRLGYTLTPVTGPRMISCTGDRTPARGSAGDPQHLAATMPGDPRTGGVLEAMILPALDRGGYSHRPQVVIGDRLGCGRHIVDAVAAKDGRLGLGIRQMAAGRWNGRTESAVRSDLPAGRCSTRPLRKSVSCARRRGLEIAPILRRRWPRSIPGIRGPRQDNDLGRVRREGESGWVVTVVDPPNIYRCKHGRAAPELLLAQLPESQAVRARHRCAVCAYDRGRVAGVQSQRPIHWRASGGTTKLIRWRTFGLYARTATPCFIGKIRHTPSMNSERC